MNSRIVHAILEFGPLVLTRAATIEVCLLTRSQETFSLSGGQSRCVEVHADLWLNRLAQLALRTVQPMHSPLTLAHPSQLSVPLLMPPRFCAGFRHCVGSLTRRRSPPVGSSTDRGRGSNPRGGTAAWSHPRRREVPHGLTEGGLLPRAPAGGIATPPRPSRPASHIHNQLSACPARACLSPVATPSHSALLARWQVPAPSRGVFHPPMPVAANVADDVVDEGGDRRWQRGRRQPCHHPRLRRRRHPPMPTPMPPAPQPLLPTTPAHGSTCRRPRPRLSAAPHLPPPQCCDAVDASPPGCHGSVVRSPLCRGLVCVLCPGATL